VRVIARTGAKAGFSEPQIIFDIICDKKLSYARDKCDKKSYILMLVKFQTLLSWSDSTRTAS
jgi:hypothetical protein